MVVVEGLVCMWRVSVVCLEGLRAKCGRLV